MSGNGGTPLVMRRPRRARQPRASRKRCTKSIITGFLRPMACPSASAAATDPTVLHDALDGPEAANAIGRGAVDVHRLVGRVGQYVVEELRRRYSNSRRRRGRSAGGQYRSPGSIHRSRFVGNAGLAIEPEVDDGAEALLSERDERVGRRVATACDRRVDLREVDDAGHHGPSIASATARPGC